MSDTQISADQNSKPDIKHEKVTARPAPFEVSEERAADGNPAGHHELRTTTKNSFNGAMARFLGLQHASLEFRNIRIQCRCFECLDDGGARLDRINQLIDP